jgi:hypothetical protein
MPKSTAKDYITTRDGLITAPPGRPKILIHTGQGKCVGIYCDQPAKVLCVETQDAPPPRGPPLVPGDAVNHLALDRSVLLRPLRPCQTAAQAVALLEAGWRSRTSAMPR